MAKVNNFLTFFIITFFVCNFIYFVSAAENINPAEKTQKIKTEYVDFELPYKATHYWSSDGLDRYEVIVYNFSIKNNSDYILKITWEDERYVDDIIQIYYDFKNNKLNQNDIKIYSLNNKSKLKFHNKNIEIGTIVGYENKLERNNVCLNKENCSYINISKPIYLWEPFKDIEIKNLPSNFLAIDDIEVGVCGTLNQSNFIYKLTNDINITTTCFIIDADNITLDLMGSKILNSTSNQIAVEWNSGNNFTLINGTLDNTKLNLDGGNGHLFKNLILNQSDFCDWHCYNVFGDTSTIINFSGYNIHDDFTSDDMNNHSWYNSTILGIDSGDGLIYGLGVGNYFYNVNFTLTEGEIFENSATCYNNLFEKSFLITDITGDNQAFVGSGNLTFIDSVIRGNDYCGGVFYYNSNNLTLINTTTSNGTGGDSFCNENGILKKWWISVVIKNSTTEFLEGVQIDIINGFGNNVISTSTNENGAITRMPITEYFLSGSDKIYYNPYVVQFSKTNYFPELKTYNLTNEQNINYSTILKYRGYDCSYGTQSTLRFIAILCSLFLPLICLVYLNKTQGGLEFNSVTLLVMIGTTIISIPICLLALQLVGGVC